MKQKSITIITVLLLCAEVFAINELGREGISDELTLGNDVILWVTQGNDKFNMPYSNRSQVSSKDEIFLIGPAFESIDKTGCLPNNCKVVQQVDPKTIDWERQCIVSLSQRYEDGSYVLSVTIGTLGRTIYRIMIVDQKYRVTIEAIS